jgi:RNA polymerase sigma factor (sigma-70 family)
MEKLESGALGSDTMPVGQVRAYLTQTAIHKALDQGKAASRRRSVSLDSDDFGELRSPEPPTEERIMIRDETRRLQDAVTLLPERRQKVVALRYFLGCEPEEIQKQLGVTRDVYRHELERGTRTVVQSLAA